MGAKKRRLGRSSFVKIPIYATDVNIWQQRMRSRLMLRALPPAGFPSYFTKMFVNTSGISFSFLLSDKNPPRIRGI